MKEILEQIQKNAAGYYIPGGCKSFAGILASTMLVSYFHFSEQAAHSPIHFVHYYLFYLIVIYAAHKFGFLGGLVSSFCLSIIYSMRSSHIHDGQEMTMLRPISEMMMLYTIGLFSGLFAQKLYGEKEKLRLVSEELKRSLELVENSIREKIRMEKEIAKSDRLRVLGQLTAGIAHEIRNPLAAIKSGVHMIKSGKRDDKIMDIVTSEIDRLNTFVERFLQYARVGKDQETEFPVVEFFDEMAELAKLLCRDKPNVAVESSIGLGRDVMMRGDRNYLKQAVLNILVNAVEAVELLEYPGIVRFSVHADSGDVLFEIGDNGKGIGDDAVENVFEPFFTTKKIGTGLGLTIAAKVVREHNGEIMARNDGGARFIIRIPAWGKA